MMTIGEAAALLHVHLSTLRRWEKSGWLRSTRVGPRGHRRYNRELMLKLAERAVRIGDVEVEA
jgi:excisionase family DNA binding protein